MIKLEYKGFTGSYQFSDADGIFFGKIEGIDDLVNFEANTEAEIEQAFKDAVDDYIETK